jgi:uncharacterized membrane protein YccC
MLGELNPNCDDRHRRKGSAGTVRKGVSRLRALVSKHGTTRPRRGELRLGLKIVVAGTLAWWLCTLLGASRPLFAVLVPLVAMDGDAFSAVSVSLTRTIGVFLGVFLGLAGRPPWAPRWR